MNKNNQNNIVIVAAIVVVGWGWIGYTVKDFQDTRLTELDSRVNELSTQVVAKQAELKKLQDFVSNIEQVKNELSELNARLDTALEYLPPTFDLSGLLRQLSQLAQFSGVTISAFRPKPEEKDAENNFYASIPIQFLIDGTFTQTLVFLDQMARLKRVVKTEEVVIEVDANKRGSNGSVGTRTTASVRAYRFAAQK